MTATVESIKQQIKSGRYEDARQELSAMESTGESPTEALFFKGRLQEVDFDRVGALACYEQVLDQDPNHAEAGFRAAWLCDQGGDESTAMELYERCLTLERVPVNALINVALLYEEQNRLAEAEACLKNILAEYPNHVRAKHLLRSVRSSATMKYDEQAQGERERHSALLDQPITEFELSVRSRNCLRQMNIRTLADLMKITEAELLSYKNFGETSLNEIKALLAQTGLRLGLTAPSAPTQSPVGPVNITGDASDHVNQPVSDLELSVRSRKCLQVLGITTLGELAMYTEAELMAGKNFGQTSLVEVKRKLAQFGLSLRE